MKKFSLFGLTFGHKRSRDSVTGGPIFANLVSKYPQDFKEKSHEAARLKAWQFCMRGKICLGGGGPPRPPTSAVRVNACQVSLLWHNSLVTQPMNFSVHTLIICEVHCDRVIGQLPMRTIPHQIKIKPNHCPPGPQSLGLFPTKTTPH